MEDKDITNKIKNFGPLIGLIVITLILSILSPEFLSIDNMLKLLFIFTII
ncbi:hypothetical protein [Vulcanibacillus modesticaldus]|nr:hypothetical protein [Vulcanibacillus modesticaldus]